MAEPHQTPIRILIVEDHAIVRSGMRLLVDTHPGMTVVGEAKNRIDAVTAAGREQPDIILLDLFLDGECDLKILSELRAAAEQTRVIIVTGVMDTDIHRRAVLQGASGLVFKEQAAEILLKAIEKVHGGEAWLDRSMTARVLASLSRQGKHGDEEADALKITALTEREKEIVVLVAQGMRRKEIAQSLFISEVTVRNHLTSILSKLELVDCFDLALFAYRHNLAKPPGQP